MVALQLKIIDLHFLISITETQTKVKIRLSSSTDFLEYRQKIKNVFRYENKVIVTLSLGFSSSKRKGKRLREVVNFYLKPFREVINFYLKKETKKSEMGNPKRRKYCAYLERIQKRTNIFKMSKRLV